MDPVKNEYGNWLQTYPWKFWCTLTFRHQPPRPHTALRKYQRWIARNDLYLPAQMYTFAATEEGRHYGRLHIHALIGGETDGNAKALWLDWFKDPYGGRAYVDAYDSEKGASHYIAKYVTKSLGEYIVGGTWPQPQP